MDDNVRKIRDNKGRFSESAPAHLIEVPNLVVELDGDLVHGALLKAIIDSGQAFNFRTIVPMPVLAHEDRLGQGSICLVIKGPGYAVEEHDHSPVRPQLKAWTMDDAVMYRVIEAGGDKGGAGGLILTIELADFPFAQHERAEHEAGHAFGEQEKFDVNTIDFDDPRVGATIVRVLGGMTTELTALSIEKKGRLTPQDLLDVMYEQLEFTDAEVNLFGDNIEEAQQIVTTLTTTMAEAFMRKVQGR